MDLYPFISDNLIPTYIINHKNCGNRKARILAQFKDRCEFKISMVEAIEDEMQPVSLLRTVKYIFQNLAYQEQEYILVCEDNHQFSKYYHKEMLFKSIIEAQENKADVLCGGLRFFNSALPVSDGLFWTENLIGFEFIIIFRNFFKTILSLDFDNVKSLNLTIGNFSDKLFFTYPFISIQNSDSLKDNRVEDLFNKISSKVEMIGDIIKYFKENKKPIDSNFDDYVIPTYVINLPERTERRAHIEAQFADRGEFDVKIINACKHEIGAVGLWDSFRKIILLAIANKDDVIIIIEDDHVFTQAYDSKKLLKVISEANRLGVEFLLGGIGGFSTAIPISKNMFWVDDFYCTQFTILFSRVFTKILNISFDEKVTSDGILSKVSINKMAIYPFVSEQKSFGYSDISQLNYQIGGLEKMFDITDARLKKIYKAQSLCQSEF